MGQMMMPFFNLQHKVAQTLLRVNYVMMSLKVCLRLKNNQGHIRIDSSGRVLKPNQPYIELRGSNASGR